MFVTSGVVNVAVDHPRAYARVLSAPFKVVLFRFQSQKCAFSSAEVENQLIKDRIEVHIALTVLDRGPKHQQTRFMCVKTLSIFDTTDLF